MANATTETRIQDKSHATNCFEELQCFWKAGKLCDLTLKVAEREFKVHKLILMSCSSYFKNMFAKELREENDKNCVELRQVEPNALRLILEYFYSGYVVLSENTVEQVLATANTFSLTGVKNICCDYLLKNINITNCISRYCMGVSFGLNELQCQTKSFIVSKLDEVSKTTHFHKISKDTLKELLTTTKPNANGEQMYTAVMNWVKNDIDNRKLSLSDLLHLIPTEKISHHFYINNMKKDTLLRQDYKCLNWLLDNISDKFAKVDAGPSYVETKLLITCRFMSTLGSFQLELKDSEIKPLPARPDLKYFSAVSYKKSIYITAGEYDGRDVEMSYKYDSHKNSWPEISLNFERHDASACILYDQLFIVGGYNKRRNCFLNSCIYYDFNYNQKSILPEMKQKRGLPGIGVYQNSAFVCCGCHELTNFSCIERYDPREGFWQTVGKYKFVNGQCSSTVISDFLYTSQQHDALVERFDFRNNNTKKLAKPVAGSSNWITSSEGKLFRVHETGLSEYDFSKNKWLNKEYNFTLDCPVVVPWDTT